jgi:transposase InsO family protein
MKKREIITELSEQYPTRLVCEVLEIAPSSYYYQSQGEDDLTLLQWIEGVIIEFPRYGYRRVTAQLRRQGHLVNHKRVLRVMRENDLISAVKGRPRTTDSQHGYGRYKNLIRDLIPQFPNHIWCADITYVQLQREYIYLAIILDLYTRSLRGWNLGRRLDSGLALQALEKALKRSKPLIHHSDQGIQYAAHNYVDRLQELGTQISMSRKGMPGDNPYAERVIRTIKEEEVYLADYQSFADAQAQIGHFIEDVYQTKRIHSSLGYLTPAEFESAYWERTDRLAVGALSTPFK